MLRLYIDRNGRGVCVHDTDGVMPPPQTDARYVQLDGRVNPHLLPRILVDPSAFVVEDVVSETEFSLFLDTPKVDESEMQKRSERYARLRAGEPPWPQG